VTIGLHLLHRQNTDRVDRQHITNSQLTIGLSIRILQCRQRPAKKFIRMRSHVLFDLTRIFIQTPVRVHEVNQLNSANELDIFRLKYDISDITYPLTNIEMERLLSKIKLSASGCDGIPA